MFLHILARTWLHFVSSILITGGVFMTIRFACRRRWRYAGWLPERRRSQLLLAAVCWPGWVVIRESWDVLHGQPAIKAWFDDASWLVLGSFLGAWLLYRFAQEWAKGDG